jgi:hypothetical protein
MTAEPVEVKIPQFAVIEINADGECTRCVSGFPDPGTALEHAKRMYVRWRDNAAEEGQIDASDFGPVEDYVQPADGELHRRREQYYSSIFVFSNKEPVISWEIMRVEAP